MKTPDQILSALRCEYEATPDNACAQCAYRHPRWGTCTGTADICKDAVELIQALMHRWQELREAIEDMRDDMQVAPVKKADVPT